jgi:hypothetical protein
LNCQAQDSISNNFYNQIKNYDLSIVLTEDSIEFDNDNKYRKSEILGFIGDEYQRLDVHFVSIIQNPVSPYEYLVYGKSKVNENICPFHGKITIVKSRIQRSLEFPDYKQGFAICDVVLYEDKKQKSTGIFKGQLTSNFMIDGKGNFSYDMLMFAGDGFSNNQFEGTWKSYKTGKSKKCNWGDYRIPNCGDLDVGVSEFMVNEKYLNNGWENYRLAWFGNSTESEQAIKKENEHWWE